MKHTPVTSAFLILCLVITIPGILLPEWYALFSGELPHIHWWQNVTMVFQHGAPGIPLAIFGHLALNMILLLTCGRFAEMLLGSGRFLILSLTAWAIFVAVQALSGIWVNGSSGVIWAYSPFLLVPVGWAKRDTRFAALAGNARNLLILMWGLITIAMAFIPLIFNATHDLLHTAVYGNLFHAVATATGFVPFLIWQAQGIDPGSRSDWPI